MIDLHMHSRYSEDGEFTPAELFVETAETAEVTTYSIASSAVITAVFIAFALYLVRKEKRREIEKTFFAV